MNTSTGITKATFTPQDIRIEAHTFAADLSCYQTLINLGSNAVVVTHTTAFYNMPHPKHNYLYPTADTCIHKIECELFAGRRIDVTKAFTFDQQDMLQEVIELDLVRSLQRESKPSATSAASFADLLHTPAHVCVESGYTHHLTRHHPSVAGCMDVDPFPAQLVGLARVAAVVVVIMGVVLGVAL